MSSEVVCVTAYYDENLGNGIIYGNNYVVLETCYVSILEM